MTMPSSLVRGGGKDRSRTWGIHEIPPGVGSKGTGNHPLQAFRITSMTGDLLAALCHHQGHIRQIPTAVHRGEVDLGAETQLPAAPTVTPGRSGLGLSRQRILPHPLVGGVGSVEDREAGHPPLLKKVGGGGINQHPGEVLAQASLPRLPPLVES